MWYDLKITWYKKDKREKKTLKSLHKRKQTIFINLSNSRLRDVWVLRWLSMNNPVSLASMSVTASHLTTRCFFFFFFFFHRSWSQLELKNIRDPCRVIWLLGEIVPIHTGFSGFLSSVKGVQQGQYILLQNISSWMFGKNNWAFQGGPFLTQSWHYHA